MLLQNGVADDMPCVAVQSGTTPNQREVWAPLNEFVEEIEEVQLKSPTLIIMGSVVALADGWKEAQAIREAKFHARNHAAKYPRVSGMLVGGPQEMT